MTASSSSVPGERFGRKGIGGALLRGVVIFVLMFVALVATALLPTALAWLLISLWVVAGVLALKWPFRRIPCGKIAGWCFLIFGLTSAIAYFDYASQKTKEGALVRDVEAYLDDRKPVDANGKELTIETFDLDGYLDWYKDTRPAERYLAEVKKLDPERWASEFPELAEREAEIRRRELEEAQAAAAREIQEQIETDCKGNKVTAYVMSQEFVRRSLKAPATAKFPRESEPGVSSTPGRNCREYQVVAYVDSQNSFGAMLRTHYRAVVKDNSDGSWSVLSLEFID